MTEKEINLKSILFLVIGILLLLSLVICIYIINGEHDLIATEASVIDVKKDETGNGKNDVTVSYDINDVTYQYNFYYKESVNLDDKITIYYHENNVNSVTTFKTKKYIFIFPILGIVLCILGIMELFKNSNKEDNEFKTEVIDTVGNTQMLEIVTDDTVVEEYVKNPEEHIEPKVKLLKKRNKSLALAENGKRKVQQVTNALKKSFNKKIVINLYSVLDKTVLLKGKDKQYEIAILYIETIAIDRNTLGDILKVILYCKDGNYLIEKNEYESLEDFVDLICLKNREIKVLTNTK